MADEVPLLPWKSVEEVSWDATTRASGNKEKSIDKFEKVSSCQEAKIKDFRD